MKRGNRRVAALAQSAQVEELTEGELRLSAASPLLVKMLGDTTDLLADAVYEIVGARWAISVQFRSRDGQR